MVLHEHKPGRGRWTWEQRALSAGVSGEVTEWGHLSSEDTWGRLCSLRAQDTGHP